MTRLRLLSRTVLTASMALAPLSAFAAFTTPGELITAVSKPSTPMGFSFQIQAQQAPNYATIWINGTSKGATPAEALMAAKSTVDVVWENGNARVKIQLRQKDGKMYLLVDDVQGKMEDATARLVASFKMKKWLQVPMDEMMDPMGMEMDMAMVNEAFTMTSAAGKNGTTVYTLTLTEPAMKMLKSMIQDMSMDLANQMADVAQPTFILTITTDSSDQLLSFAVSVTAKAPEGMVSVTGSAWRVSGTFTVAEPSPIYSFSEGFFGLGSTSNLEDWPEWIGTPVTDISADDDWMDDWSDSSMMEDDVWMESMEDMTEQDGAAEGLGWTWSEPECNASQLRRGECPQMVPASPRRQ